LGTSPNGRLWRELARYPILAPEEALKELKMTEEPKDDGPQNKQPGKNQPPTLFIPKSFFYIVGAIVVGSFLLTLFVRNPYTQAVHEGGNFYENATDNSLMMWVAIFIGIPASFWAYKRWIIPLFDRK
jgi:hypothetical protein